MTDGIQFSGEMKGLNRNRKRRKHPAGDTIVYLSHIDDSYSQSLVAKDGSILVALPPLQHNLQSVGISLQKMWVLEVTQKNKGGLTMQTTSCIDIKVNETIPLKL